MNTLHTVQFSLFVFILFIIIVTFIKMHVETNNNFSLLIKFSCFFNTNINHHFYFVGVCVSLIPFSCVMVLYSVLDGHFFPRCVHFISFVILISSRCLYHDAMLVVMYLFFFSVESVIRSLALHVFVCSITIPRLGETAIRSYFESSIKSRAVHFYELNELGNCNSFKTK